MVLGLVSLATLAFSGERPLGSGKAREEPEPLALARIREAVAANEAKLNPIRLRFKTTFDVQGEASAATPAFRQRGRRFSHADCEWAQKGQKHFARLSYFFSPVELWRTTVYVVDETNWTSAVLPHGSSRSIQAREKLKWNAELQVTALGLRPFEGDFSLSEILQPQWATLSHQTEEINGRPAAVVEAKRRVVNPDHPAYYGRLWIDAERGVVLRIRYFAEKATVQDRQPISAVDGIRHYRLSNGGWFPVAGTRILHFADRTATEHINVDIDSITFNPAEIPDSFFTMDSALDALQSDVRR